MQLDTKRLVLACFIWLAALTVTWLGFVSHRFLTSLLFLPLTGCCWWIGGTWKRTSVFIVASAVVFLIPVETTFESVAGYPRLISLRMGLVLDRHDFEGDWTGFRSDSSGDWYAGGDVVSGLEPKWLLVW
jgi:hypothetical protein